SGECDNLLHVAEFGGKLGALCLAEVPGIQTRHCRTFSECCSTGECPLVDGPDCRLVKQRGGAEHVQSLGHRRLDERSVTHGNSTHARSHGAHGSSERQQYALALEPAG